MNQVKNNNKLISIELFAGAGGMALGFENQNYHPLFLVENNKDAIKTLKRNRNKWNVIDKDIKQISNEEILNLSKDIKIDIITAGFPCQPFSYAGKKLGFEDDRGDLFWEFLRFVDLIKPNAFLIENVPGLKSHLKGKSLEIILENLKNRNYEIEWKILNSNDYGVPQKRKRLIIIGFKRELNLLNSFNWPTIEQYKPTLKDALINVPNSPGYEYPEKKLKILKMVPPGGCWKNLPEEIAKKYMGNSYYLGGGKTGIARRISWDEPSLTLTTSPMQKQTERCHPDEVRPFRIREYARIQTFPDEWIFEGSINSSYKQIGNAVPILLAEKIAKQLRKVLNG